MGCADLETRSPRAPAGMVRCVRSGPDVSSTLRLLILLKLSSPAQASGSRAEQQGWPGFFFLFLWVGIVSSGFHLLCPQGPGAGAPGIFTAPLAAKRAGLSSGELESREEAS